MPTLRLGTRNTPLAIAQARIAQEALLSNGTYSDLVFYDTSGDQDQRPLRFTEGKGLFIKELEYALLDKSIDVAVHSYKDIPYALTPNLTIAGVLERIDARDVLLSQSCLKIESFKTFFGKIGTCSLRRQIQLKKIFPQAHIVDIRGNINTRIQKMHEGKVDALVLAYAGLKRLNLDQNITHVFSTNDLIPSPTQGMLALQCRTHDIKICNLLKKCTHTETYHVSLIERGFVTAIQGTCDTPLGGYARIQDEHLSFEGMLATPHGLAQVTLQENPPLRDITNFFEHGKLLGQKLLRMHHEHPHYSKS